MKLILILLILTVNLTYGQESKKYLKLKQDFHYREGYILNKDSMKVKGLIKDRTMNEAKKYSVVTFVELDGTKKNHYPNSIKGFGYMFYKFESDDKSSFYKVVSKGKKVSLYEKVNISSNSLPAMGGMGPMSYSTSKKDFYVKRNNEKTFNLVRKRNFAEYFSEYFKDCEELVNKILTKEYTHENIERMVSKYNYCK